MDEGHTVDARYHFKCKSDTFVRWSLIKQTFSTECNCCTAFLPKVLCNVQCVELSWFLFAEVLSVTDSSKPTRSLHENFHISLTMTTKKQCVMNAKVSFQFVIGKVVITVWYSIIKHKSNNEASCKFCSLTCSCTNLTFLSLYAVIFWHLLLV